ncbi:MAG: glycerate kinase, partial [Actinomycetota bacterium]|nr:glycerate kinase [Actinomycetota bacterium]
GEGTVDLSSSEGKVPAGVTAACARRRVPCYVFGGRVEEGATHALTDAGAAAVAALSGRPERAREDLVALGETLARLF